MRTASTGKRPVGVYGGVVVWVPVVAPPDIRPSSGDEAIVEAVVVAAVAFGTSADGVNCTVVVSMLVSAANDTLS